MTQRFDTYLQVRLTSHDKERIKARAKVSGEKSTSEYVRKRALDITIRKPEIHQLERNVRGSVEMQPSRNNP